MPKSQLIDYRYSSSPYEGHPANLSARIFGDDALVYYVCLFIQSGVNACDCSDVDVQKTHAIKRVSCFSLSGEAVALFEYLQRQPKEMYGNP